MSDRSTPAALLEREAEVDALRLAVSEATADAGRLVLIDAPAGAGKTSLMEAARALCEETGVRVLNARGAELEREFALGVVRQLFDGVLRDGATRPEVLFAGAARFAPALLDVDLEDQPAPPPDDPFAARHALYWLTANLAGQHELALLVDDAHWADGASLGTLAHLANRLDGIPVLLVVAMRSEESSPALDDLRAQAGERGTMLRLRPLGRDATAVIVRSFAPDADDELVSACLAATGGNPFLLNELGRSALESGTATPAHVADQSPERVTREVAARLARLPADAARLARAAAVLGGDVPLRQAAELAGLEHDRALAVADGLIAAGVLGNAQPLDFLHPLVRAAVYAGMGPGARSREHARAARLLADEGAAPERVAAQLLRCDPVGDRWAYEPLVEAARLAMARGSAEVAATYFRRALDEPPPPAERTELLLELGAAESAVPQPEEAIAHLREALSGRVETVHRFRATMLLAGMLGQTARPAEAADVLEAQIAALAGEPALATAAEAAYLNVTRTDPTTRARALQIAARLRRLVDEEDDVDPAVLGAVAPELAMAGDPADEAARVAERALAAIEGTAAAATGWSLWNAIRTLGLAERYDMALDALDHALAIARERGVLLDTGAVYTFRAELLYQMGDLAAAEVDARTLQEIAVACAWPMAEGFAVAWLCEVLVCRGELVEAEGLFGDGPFAAPPSALRQIYPSTWILIARGRLRQAQGRLDDAAEDFREAGRRADAIGHVNPALVEWRSALTHVLVDQGRAADARPLAMENLERARAFGAPRALSVALRAAARTVTPAEAQLAMLRDAVAAAEGSQSQLELARAQTTLGAALREGGKGKEAQPLLRAAVETAHRREAHALGEEALTELRATGARPRRRVTAGADALTPSERRITELAAAGQQNREIAETLFVTTNTIEFHLRNAYRKLGIASRTQLGDALA